MEEHLIKQLQRPALSPELIFITQIWQVIWTITGATSQKMLLIFFPYI